MPCTCRKRFPPQASREGHLFPQTSTFLVEEWYPSTHVPFSWLAFAIPRSWHPLCSVLRKWARNSARNTEKLANQLRFCQNSVNIFE